MPIIKHEQIKYNGEAVLKKNKIFSNTPNLLKETIYKFVFIENL